MAVELWMVGAGANVTLAIVYGAISLIMLQGLVRGRQWFTNPLATATAGIFVTCTLGHGLHAFHTLEPSLGFGHATGAAARTAMASPLLLSWDVLTAVVAVWYFTLRSRLQLIFEGAALCEDLEERHAKAQELHDNVVQGLVQAKLALDLGRREEGERAIAETLESAKSIITGLLGDARKAPLGPGDLRRERAA